MNDRQIVDVLEALFNWAKLSRFNPVVTVGSDGRVFVTSAPCCCATAMVEIDFPVGLEFYSRVERRLIADIDRCEDNCTCHARDLFYVPAGARFDSPQEFSEIDEAA